MSFIRTLTTTRSRCVRQAWRSTTHDTSHVSVRETSEWKSLTSTFRKLSISTCLMTISSGSTTPMKDSIRVCLDSIISVLMFFQFLFIVTHSDSVGRRGQDVRARLFVCLFVYLQLNSKTKYLNAFKLDIGNNLGIFVTVVKVRVRVNSDMVYSMIAFQLTLQFDLVWQQDGTVKCFNRC